MEFNCMEVVAVRLFNPESGNDVTNLFNGIRAGTSYIREGIAGLNLYNYSGLDSDWRIEIQRDTRRRVPQKTDLGLHIAAAFSEIGLVHHEVWCCCATVNKIKKDQ